MFPVVLRLPWPLSLSLAVGLIPGVASQAFAQKYTATDRQPTPEELSQLPGYMPEKAAALLKDVRVPDDFEVSIFATPPAVNYPVYLAATPDGTLYVSSDGNGSLDRKPHLGRVLRVRDRDGDGHADEVKAFVPDVDSPRGLVWDHDRLYLLHPPDISVYFDRDGDGVMDEEKTLVKGIAFTFKDRPADHTSNGLELGIDGWLYAAIGDFGFMEATGADGRKLQLRGGGVVRVRPDGTGLELYAEGTRNILEVAVSPLLDAFARDNTNDGGGWDVRFHHFSGLTQHGYPKLFKNFPGEYVPPLADYGGGAGCGAAWVDEPGIPSRWNNAPFTCDWGRDWIYHHGLTRSGATFAVTQEEFIHLPRPTDLDVDGQGAIYASSWKGASFTWVGPEVGFLIRATAKGSRPERVPDFAKATGSELLKLLESPSHRVRLAAERMWVRRQTDGTVSEARPGLIALASDRAKPLASRVAALFAIALAPGPDLPRVLNQLALDESIAGWVMRAMGEQSTSNRNSPATAPIAALRSANPIIRKEAVVALARMGDEHNRRAVAALLADPDAIVAHTSVRALIRLQAIDECLSVVDDGEANPTQRAGALQVLQSLPQPRVVDALLTRLARETDLERRAGLLSTLCRLHFVEGSWKGDSWGTRPDTRGPFYQPEPWSETPKIFAALNEALDHGDPKETAFLWRELARHRIGGQALVNQLILRAQSDASLLPALALQLADAEEVPLMAVPLLVQVATAPATSDAARAQAIIALVKTEREEAWHAALDALPRVQKTATENNLAERARRAFFDSSKMILMANVFAPRASRVSGDDSMLAESALLRIASRQVGSPEGRAVATQSLDIGWAETKRRVQILKAAAQSGEASRAAQFVAALDDPNPEVAAVAKETVRRLKLDPEKFRAEAKAPHAIPNQRIDNSVRPKTLFQSQPTQKPRGGMRS